MVGAVQLRVTDAPSTRAAPTTMLTRMNPTRTNQECDLGVVLIREARALARAPVLLQEQEQPGEGFSCSARSGPRRLVGAGHGEDSAGCGTMEGSLGESGAAFPLFGAITIAMARSPATSATAAKKIVRATIESWRAVRMSETSRNSAAQMLRGQSVRPSICRSFFPTPEPVKLA